MEGPPRSKACPLFRHHHHDHHHVHCQFFWRHNPCHHHHHHHSHHHHHHHPTFAPVLRHNRKPIGSYLLQKESLLDADADEETAECIEQVFNEPEQDGLEGGEENEEEDPIFVLTDEWKEFFAKSEAKRKLEKQQAKRKAKH